MSSTTIGGPELGGGNESDHGRKKTVELCERSAVTNERWTGGMLHMFPY